MMFAKVMAAAVSIGALGGASIAVGQNLSTPTPVTAMDSDTVSFEQIAQRSSDSAACQEVAFRIYFEEGSAALNSEARDTIKAATKDLKNCGAVDVQLAAAASRLDSTAERHLSSQRSVAVLSAMRAQGVSGNVYVAPVSNVVVAAERNAGPDFVEVAIAPSTGGQLLSDIASGAESSSL